MDNKDRYVVITPARNEEEHIGRTVESVVSQTIQPMRYVVVSDGSTDRTDDIVREWEARTPFVTLLRREANEFRNFGSKVYALREGLATLSDEDYDFIAYLDADIRLEPSYFEKLLKVFNEKADLGIAGGVICEQSEEGNWRPMFYSYDFSVAGAVQCFRRRCHEEVGGYLPLRLGGIDMIAETNAKMRGWKVRTLPDLPVYHYRRTGTESGGGLRYWWKRGRMEYSHGYHPVFQIARLFSRWRDSPVILGSLVRTISYAWYSLMRERSDVPEDIRRYMKREQIARLFNRGG